MAKAALPLGCGLAALCGSQSRLRPPIIRRLPVVWLLCAAPCLAAGLRAGSAGDGYARAIAVADNKGGLAVLVTAEGTTLTPSIVDVASARLEKDFGMERSSLLFLSAQGEGNSDSALAITGRLYGVARDAIRNLAPARVTEARVLPGRSERALAGPIRSAYTSIDLGLARPASYPVQAIQFGRTLTILALAGEPEVNASEGVVVLRNANGFQGALEDSGGRIADAIRNVLARVGPRNH
ncbi:MAG: hypothetical protein ABSF98_15075 [Bryobacteraceae bacterium]